MDLHKIVDSLLPTLGEAGVLLLKEKVDDLVAEAKEPWKKAVLALVSNAVATYGPQGIEVARKYIHDLLGGGQPPVIDWLDLETASDILAQMQNAEADRLSSSNEFLTKVGHVLGEILTAFIKGLIK